ncbi:MOSC N-terminal beta barrel domain-containing protein [Burkholderia pseudomultivorans]|uniref:MOSC domain-containing protein n=1 Tax=Burkholderia pseudomultivorans TaxID=1207504 RepID=UPI00075F38F5|nr:MOSC N-terminal beta barrel domain-containing protein [Burkholderia pseudomultivorans]KVC26707.1 Fe-S protein [Burkholderia pseudomultivorans]KVC29975.1 Fe-S protein [Burkholderia pseudomultivorans]KVC46580.1 Fe-S protein [Burkholderia pseudomultivorans]MDS0796493.1 MOSC N-terminal beta barrel domain-containing protein [Burkholderia pseudomultivorans]
MPAIAELFVYPIKSCGGLALPRAQLLDTGLAYDRHWMVTDANGQMITQRTHARLALVQPAFDGDTLVLNAPGMPELRTPLDGDASSATPTMAATVWRDTVEAIDTGVDTAAWFSEYLGMPATLARFAPGSRRACSAKWTGDIDASTKFADGYPLLVIGQASLDDLNARLVAKGAPAIPMNRFRPNIVVAGLDAYEEDYVEHLDADAGGAAAVRLRLVKLCTRCPMPTIDQRTGAPDPAWPHEPTDTMQTYRAHPNYDNALTFGNNAIVVHGAGAWLEVGQPLDAEIGFGD